MESTTVPIQALCNTILKKSFTEGISVTPMKLQKLLYFIYRDYLKVFDKDLFTEKFEVWQFGPVLPSVYNEFHCFHSSRITQFAKNANGSATIISDREEARPIMNSIDRVWEMYKNYTGIELSQITHRPGSAWYKAYQRNENTLCRQDIKDEEISN